MILTAPFWLLLFILALCVLVIGCNASDASALQYRAVFMLGVPIQRVQLAVGIITANPLAVPVHKVVDAPAVQTIALASVPFIASRVIAPRLAVREGQVIDLVPAILEREGKCTVAVAARDGLFHGVRADALRRVAVGPVNDAVVAEPEHGVVHVADRIATCATDLDHHIAAGLEWRLCSPGVMERLNRAFAE